MNWPTELTGVDQFCRTLEDQLLELLVNLATLDIGVDQSWIIPIAQLLVLLV